MPRPRLIDRIIDKGMEAPLYERYFSPSQVAGEGRNYRSWFYEEGDWRQLDDRALVKLISTFDPTYRPPVAINAAKVAMEARRGRLMLKELDALSDEALGRRRLRQVVPYTRPDWGMRREDVVDCPVVVADNVARYLQALGPQEPRSVISRVLPPHERMFVEMEMKVPLTTPDHLDEVAVGFLFEMIGNSEAHGLFGGIPAFGSEPTYFVRVRGVLQYGREPIIGATYDGVLSLGDDGRMLTAPNGHTTGLRGMVGLGPPYIPTGPEANIANTGNIGLAPALMTISLMHCKNVSIETVSPASPTSRKKRRTRDRPLERYSVVNFGGMRQVLEREGEIREKGLEHALHFVRAHYKTFTPERPLFGRHVGEYLWTEQVRGTPEAGVSTKDYRVSDRALEPPGLGTSD